MFDPAGGRSAVSFVAPRTSRELLSSCPTAARPAICPSTSANSTPPMPVGSPAQKTPGTEVCWNSIHLHEAIVDLATQQRWQFNVGHQMKSASEIVARDDFRLAASRDRNALEHLLAVRCQRPAVGRERNARRGLSSTATPGESFPDKRTSEAPNRARLRPRCLFANR